MFAKQLKQASSLDDIIAAHNNFVDSVRHGTLLDEESQVKHFRIVIFRSSIFYFFVSILKNSNF